MTRHFRSFFGTLDRRLAAASHVSSWKKAQSEVNGAVRCPGAHRIASLSSMFGAYRSAIRGESGHRVGLQSMFVGSRTSTSWFFHRT